MFILTSLTRYASDYRARRRRMNSYLRLSSLPIEIQKDIGWGDVAEDEQRDRRARKR